MTTSGTGLPRPLPAGPCSPPVWTASAAPGPWRRLDRPDTAGSCPRCCADESPARRSRRSCRSERRWSQRILDEQAVGDRDPVLGRQIPVADRRPSAALTGHTGHRLCVDGSVVVVHHPPIGMDPLIVRAPDSLPPVPCGAFVDPDLTGCSSGRPARCDQLQATTLGFEFALR